MDPLAELIGESPGLVAVREQVRRLLRRRSEGQRLPPILLQGETGTGKGVLARALHRAGPRAGGPFVDVNCAAIPETLLEAELFGYERGAFTDARQAKPGLFQTAHRGTLFLDEVGLLPEGLQAKLLTVLEERAVRRLGATRSEPADVWIIAASNQDLAVAARARRFREDLYHRLAVLTLWLPPLRERGQDILHLAEHFLARACRDYALPSRALAADARAALLAYPWPGNIRELANVIERIALLSESGEVTAAVLGLPETGRGEPRQDPREPAAATLDEAVRGHLLDILRQTQWNISRAAARLGISRNTLRARIEKYGLRQETAAPPRRRVARGEAPTPAPPIAPGTPGLRWERRRLTLLRAVVLPAGEAAAPETSRAIEVLVDKVQSFGGRVEELSPIGLVATFGLEPVEDAPRRAALAAVAIQKAADRARADPGEPPAFKIGIHTGQFMLGQVGRAATIDLEAKREAGAVLEALIAGAEPDSISVSEAAAPFLERDFALIPEGAAGGHGRAFSLVAAERPGLGRRMAAFVGRGHELELLQGRLLTAMQGHGQVVGILGEAGIGKSRLILEFRRSLADAQVTYLEGRCQSYGAAIPYLPVLEILRESFRITETDTPEAIAAKIRVGLQDVGMDPDESAPYLLWLLGVKEGTERLAALSPGAIKARTFETLQQMILNGSRRRPIVFVVEDLHWVDTMTEECFASLMEIGAGVPVLFFGTYRPGYRPPWVERSYVTQVALQPLSREDSLSVVRSVLRRDDVPEALAAVILDKAEGNPFFLEELARSVGTTEELRAPAAVPDTIQEVLLARADRLTEEPRRLLQVAAVIGREIPLPLLQAVWEGPGELDPHLRELTRLEFLYLQSGRPEPAYAFTHTLTQEVVYEGLTISQRQALHAAAARALEAIHAGRLEEVYDRLGHHYSRAEQAAKALEYLTRLAERAARGHAHTEAIRILDDALAHVDRLPPEERDRCHLDLLLRQASSFVPLGRFQEIITLLAPHQATLERLDDPRLSGHYHFLLSRSYLFIGDDARATEHAEAGLAEASRGGDEATLGKVHYVLAQQGALAGRPHEGLDHARQAVALLERAQERWWLGPAYWAMGLNRMVRGEFEAALEAEAQAAALGEIVGDPELESCAAWTTGIIHAARGDWEAGIQACQRGLERAPDPLTTAIALGWLGHAYLEKGEAARAIPVLEQAVEQVGQFRFAQLLGLFMAFLAEAYGAIGEVEKALALARRGLTVTRQASSLYGVGCLQRSLGRIARVQGDLPEAEARLGEALGTFAAMQARYDLGRTRLDLAALAQERGEPAAAAAHLGEAHALFQALRIPEYVKRSLGLAARLGLRLAEP
ncbi:MAG: sigma 54-interacting transcriptional regulator [Candidatus Rokubacteria bacterium]|nr:sigma 54-interacting transcriptional regulator [Candidatus Rokubacteria bacterium]